MTNLGTWGEEEGSRFLEKQGLKIIERHFFTRWGEIDLIARDGDTWVFVEVKTRASAQLPSAAEAITPAKQRRLTQTALMYMKKRRLEGNAMRFDVLLHEGREFEWIPDAFEPSEEYTF